MVHGSAAGQDGALCDGCHQKLAEEDHEERERQAVGIGHPWVGTSIGIVAVVQGLGGVEASQSRSIAWCMSRELGVFGE